MAARDLVALSEPVEAAHCGGKAASLSRALQAGLSVPSGVALGWELAAEAAAGASEAIARVREASARLRFPVAVRSSALDEDSRGTSFAGQHLTQLGVGSAEAVVEAVRAVVASGGAQSAQAYRQRVGASSQVRMGVVVQELVRARVAGVLFTCDPVTGRDERVVEAAWGLGEVVVQGLVVPDRFRVDRQGRVLERTPGDKLVELLLSEGGGTRQVEVEAPRREALCLTQGEVEALHQLALACERLERGALDLEWAFDEHRLFLLQCRPVTRAGKSGPAR